MINLLPPAIKEEVLYSRRNAILVRYLKLTITVSVVLAGILLGGRYYLDQQSAGASQRMSSKQDEIARYKELEQKATALNLRLNSIQTLQKSQAKFSVLLTDLAQYMPTGTSIASIGLTGDDKKPVQLAVHAVDYKTALGFRDSIAKSKRISAADIESIKPNSEGTAGSFNVTVTFIFSPGGAK